MSDLKLIAATEDENMRVDRFLSDKQNVHTRSQLAKLFDENKITVNGQARAKSYKLKIGDSVEIIVNNLDCKADNFTVKSQDLPLEILFEDEYLLIVNKPRGMVVHPAAQGESGTLVNALLHHCDGKLSTIGGKLRPGIVHRIDKDTSGLLVVAKTNEAHENLATQAEAHSMRRIYEGVVLGNLKLDEGIVDAPIGRHPTHRTKNTVRDGGRDAVTHYRVLQRFIGYTHVEFTLETGRTHQIRVHMAHLGHAVAGDLIYSAKPIKSLNGQCLHARSLGFIHPISGEQMDFTSKLPQYFTDFLSLMSQE